MRPLRSLATGLILSLTFAAAPALAAKPGSARASRAPTRALDRKALELRLLDTLPKTPEASLEQAQAQNEAASAVLKTFVDAPLTVTYSGKSWSFSSSEVATWLRFAASAPPSLAIDPEAARAALMETLGPSIRPLAENARFKVVNNAVTLLPSRPGLAPDVASFVADATPLLTDPARPRAVALKTVPYEPTLTTEKAQTLQISTRLSSYRTTFPSNARSRVNNIYLLADSLDGKLVGPGQVFSFNGAVGQRTAAKGYKEAPAIINGKLKPSMGGGICQVGTTLFNTVFESGLPIVERTNHSLYISHYPAGRDATVSWGGPDLKFKNDTDHWILLSTSHTPGSLKIELWGTATGYTVTSKKTPWYGVRTFETIERSDPSLPLGTRKVDERGQTGRSCSVTRTVMKGGELVRRDTFVSNYATKPQEVRVGTGLPATATSEPGVPPATPVPLLPTPSL